MNTLIVLCHPAKDSLNHAAAARITAGLEEGGHEVRFHDLYAEGFDPVLSGEELLRRFSFDEVVQAHTRDLRWAGLLVFVHPDWWGFAPAVLKGWLDRVFRTGVAYDYVGEEFGAKRHVGLLSDKSVLVVCTTDQESSHAVVTVWESAIFPFCGISRSRFEVLSDVRTSRLRQRQAFIERALESASEMANLSPEP